jgi:ketosteroid isomerase-like protein
MTSDAEIGRAFMHALWAGDLETCGAMMSGDARWHFQYGMPQADLAHGRVWPAREALARLVADLFGKFDPEGFAVTLTRVIASDGAVALEYEARGRTGRGDAYHNVYVTTLTIADGKVTDIRPYNDTAHMLRLLTDSAPAPPSPKEQDDES